MSILDQVAAARSGIVAQASDVARALPSPSVNGNGHAPAPAAAASAGAAQLLQALQGIQAQAVSAASQSILASAVAAAEQAAQGAVSAAVQPLLEALQAQLSGIKAQTDPAELRAAARAAITEEIVDPTSRAAALAGGATELHPELLPVDPLYCDTDTGRKVARWLRTGRAFAYVSGPSGSGKTFPIENELRRAGLRYLLVSCNGQTTVGQLIGRQDASNGSTRWTDGPVVRAMRQGYALVLDEVGKLDPLVGACLNRVLDRQPRLLTPWGEDIVPAAGFRVLATGNALTDDTGIFVEHQASAELPGRAAGGLILAGYLKPDEECAIIQRATAVSSQTAAAIVTALGNLRVCVKAGTVTLPASLRTGLAVAEDLSDSHGAGALSWSEAWDAAMLHGLKPSEAEAARRAIGALS